MIKNGKSTRDIDNKVRRVVCGVYFRMGIPKKASRYLIAGRKEYN